MPSLTPEIVPLDQSLSANAVVERHIVLTSSTKYKCLNPFFNNQQPQSSSLVRESQNVTLVRTDLYPTVSKGGMEIWNTARHQPVITYNANLNGNAKVSICGHTVLLRNSGSPNLVCFWVFPPNLDKQERQSPVEVVIPDQYFQKLRKEVSNWQYVLHNEQFLCFVSSLDSDQNDRHIRLYRIPEYGEAMKNLLPSDNVTNADDSCSYSHYVNNPKWHQKRTLARLIATYPLLDIPSDIAFITRTHLISYNSIGTVVHRLSDLRVVGSQRRPSEDWHGWPDGFWTTDDGSSIVYLNKVERGRRGIFLYDFVNGFRVWKRDGDERGVWVYVRERDGAGGKGEGGVWRSRMLWKSLEE
ncbi:hypothetical protein HK097_006918 [Rhizophlyctis rosea]|uniref:Uncharacterized protein n=1 Tax=Rhizophlyctis rosea TaxID=64517 RepID=A0AAD5SDU2_9FUNG|nr:hypothetical protein HK097_006918 [Rhizophlyctis rosea]